MVPARPAPAPAPPKPAFHRTPLFGALVIAAAVALTYANSFGVPFVFDDELAIVSNPTIRSLWTAFSPPYSDAMGGLPISGRPVANLLVAVNYAISGSAVWSYHLVNILVHIAAGLVLFGVVRRTLLQPALAPRFGAHAFEIALLVAALWTLHPLQTESVTYISQRAEALLGLFYLLTLWCYLRSTEPGSAAKWSVLAFAACLLGMATKEVMVSAPLFVALYDRALIAGSWREVWTRRKKLLLALASTWLLLAWFVGRAGGARGMSAGFGLGVPWWSYLLKQCDAIVVYLKLCFWPQPLILDYGTDVVRNVGEVWWQGLLLLALFFGTLWALVRRPALGCVGAWFFLILAPSSSVLPLVGQTTAEHRMYLPLAAVVLLVVTAAYLRFGRTALAVLTIAAVALAATTVRRNQDYATTISICEDTVAKRPGNARAMALLADYYHRAGQLDKARQWLERSLEIEPGVFPVLNNLGDVWQELGNGGKAVACFQQALALRPDDAGTRNNLGNALILSGRIPEGIAELETALRMAPGSTRTRLNLANILAQSGRPADAAAQFEALLKSEPDNAEAHYDFGNVLMALGRWSDAIDQLESAARLQPDNADIHNRLGVALARTRRMREALEQFTAAVRLNPALESARQNASRAQQMLGGN